jgi:hypothetical protein
MLPSLAQMLPSLVFPSLDQGLLGIASGALVGFSLGLVGGGGSILAVPLLIYVVGVHDPHIAIGKNLLRLLVVGLGAGLTGSGSIGIASAAVSAARRRRAPA